jgi:hypothetical protein
MALSEKESFPMLALAPIAAAASLLAASTAGAAPKEQGTWWEVTHETKFPKGAQQRPPPPQVEKECLPVKLDGAPPTNGDCQVSGVKRSGKTTSWKMVCQGAPAEGELTVSGDTFTSRVVFRGPQGDSVFTGRGKKLGGTCDPDEADRKEAALAAYEKRGLHGEEQICGTAVQELDPAPFTGDAVICKDPQMKLDFCESARSREGLLTLSERGRDAQRKTALAFCGEDEAKLRAKHCSGAMKLKDDQDVVFAVAICPEAAALAKKECPAGDYTRAKGQYRVFCAGWEGRQADLQEAAGANKR